MRKVLQLVIIGMILSVSAACGRAGGNNQTTSPVPATAPTITESTVIEEETTTQMGIISNSAGIIVRKQEKETTEPAATEFVKDEKSFYSAEKDAERLGVSKIVVLQADKNITYNVGTDILSSFNTLLVDKYNCDFVVSFVGVDILKNYYDTLKDLKSRGQQLDIIMAANDADYDRLIREAALSELTEYLTTTEEGIKLYNEYPEEMWESVCREGKIYGYDNDVITAKTNILRCNKGIAEKLGLEVKEGFSFYDIGEILADTDVSPIIEEGVIPLYIDEECLYIMLGYYDIGCGIFAKKDAAGNWVAFNGLEDEEFNKLFNTLYEYKEKGWLKTGKAGKARSAANEGMFLFEAFSCEYSVDYPFGETEDKLLTTATSNGEKIIDVIPGATYYGFRDLMKDDIYGVTSWSEHKEEALKLITLLSTEEELANLLRYGIENKYYIYRDRIVRKLPTGNARAMGNGAPVNLALTYPQYVEPDAKQEFYKTQFSKCEAGPFLEYEILHDRLDALKERHDPDNILGQIYVQGYAKLMAGEYEDVVSAVGEIKRIQKEAGIDEYIAAINEEFESQRRLER